MMGKAWEEVAPQIWAFFQDGVQVKMIQVGRHCGVTEEFDLKSTLCNVDTHKVAS